MKKAVGLISLFFLAAGFLSAATIIVQEPAANTIWGKGEFHDIRWAPVGASGPVVTISLMNSTATAVVLVIAPAAPNNGLYHQWHVATDIPDGAYKVRVKVQGMDVQGDSDLLKIVSRVSVTKPAANENWHYYSTPGHLIQWTLDGPAQGSWSLSLMSADGTTVVSAHPGSFGCCSIGTDWPSPFEAPPGTYRIRMKLGPTGVEGLSPTFNLRSEFAHLTQPPAGASLAQGGHVVITWERSGYESAPVRIRLMNEHQQPSATIADSAPNSGSFAWTVPANLPVGPYYILLEVLGRDVHTRSGSFNIVFGLRSPASIKK